MHLTPHEQERLLVHVAADVAQRRRDRGLQLNHAEGVAILTAFVLEGARDGMSVADLMEAGPAAGTPARVKAAARTVARPRRDGGVGFPTLRSAPPLTLRETGPRRLSIAGSAAGPLGGDELALDLDVQPGCALEVKSIAAGMAWPAPTAAGAASPWSRLTTTVEVGADAVRLDAAAGDRLHRRPPPQ